MTDLRLTPLAASLPSTVPFVGPETAERAMGHPFRARLGANENGFGPSPAVIEAIAQAAPEAWMYGDPEAFELQQALAAHHGIPAEAIMPGEGIDGLLGYIVRLYAGAGDAVVTSAGAYPTFNYHVAGFGATLHTVPYDGDHEDPVALVAKAQEVGAKLIYLANPDNPMGTWHSAGTVQKMIDAVPDGALLVLDEAYVDLAPDGTAPEFDISDPRVIRMRTFSKAHGLAGMRVGYAVGHPEVISGLNKVRNHFGLGRVSQAAALAALKDQAYFAQTLHNVAQARERIGQIAEQNGLHVLASATNFVTIDCGADGDFARAVLAALVADGIFVRMPFVAPQDRCIRISAGPEAALDAFAKALPRALITARSA